MVAHNDVVVFPLFNKTQDVLSDTISVARLRQPETRDDFRLVFEASIGYNFFSSFEDFTRFLSLIVRDVYDVKRSLVSSYEFSSKL